jgi:hypothetical protein
MGDRSTVRPLFSRLLSSLRRSENAASLALETQTLKRLTEAQELLKASISDVAQLSEFDPSSYITMEVSAGRSDAAAAWIAAAYEASLRNQAAYDGGIVAPEAYFDLPIYDLNVRLYQHELAHVIRVFQRVWTQHLNGLLADVREAIRAALLDKHPDHTHGVIFSQRRWFLLHGSHPPPHTTAPSILAVSGATAN